MKIVVAIAVAMTIMVAVNAGAGRDFACGEAVGFLCAGVPKDQIKICLAEHRRELDKPCHDRVVEHEEFMCGLEIEHFCGKLHENKTAFHECIKEHAEELKKTCPEMEKFDKFEEREAIRCGYEVEKYCSKCKDKVCVHKCIETLVEKTEECRVTWYDDINFDCGVAVAADCGKSQELGPIEFVQCIEEKKPCDAKN